MKAIGKGFMMITGMMLALVAGAGETPAAQNIRVGGAINMTGPASTFGQYHAKGMKDYFRYVNEVRKGVDGRQIEMLLVDTGYKVPEAVAAVRKFAVQERVDMMATWGAGEGLAAKPIVQRYRIPTINFSTSWEILQPPVSYMFLPFGSYRMDCQAVLEYIRAVHKGKEAPRVGLLTYNNAYGRSIHQPTREYAAQNGINLVAVEEFPPKTMDLTTEMLRLKKKNVEYVFMQVLPATVVTALKNADRTAYKPLFLGTWTSTDPDFFPMAKGLIRDRLVIQFPGGVPSDRSKGVKVLQALWKRYGTVKEFDASYWEGVVVGMIMERAFIRAKEKYGRIDASTINRAMEGFRNEEFGGLVPPVTYTATEHGASFTARMVRVSENGEFVPLTNFYVPGKEKIRILKK